MVETINLYRESPFKLFSLILLSLVSLKLAAQPITFYLSVDSKQYAEPAPIHVLRNEFKKSFHPGSRAFSYNALELGVHSGPWQIGLISRYDYLAEFSPDTAELIHLSEINGPVEKNREYNIFLRVNHIKANGIKLAYQFKPFYSLQSKLSLSVLEAKELTLGTVYGSVSAFNDDSVQGAIDVDYVYTEDKLLKRPVSPPKGYGYAVDLAISWHPNQQHLRQFYAELSIKDLYSRIWWNDTPHSDLRLEPIEPRLDENGFIITTPTLTGIEDERNIIQTLPTKTQLTLGYTFDNGLMTYIETFHTNVKSLSATGIGYSPQPKHYLTWSYNWRHHIHTIGYTAERYKLSVFSDELRLRRAQVAGLTVEYRW